MEENEQIESIRALILNNKKPSYQTTNKREVRVRCPYCGDSKSDPSDAHMYIAMKPPFMFHCFKCETSGVLNQQTLRDLGIYNQDLNLGIIAANKNFKQNSGIQKISTAKRNLQNTPVDSFASQNAVNYFNSRYGTNLSNEFIIGKFKAITDPINFFQENNIKKIWQEDPNQPFDYSKAIGFISSDSTHIVFRDIIGQQRRRYNNCNLTAMQNITTASKIYNISNEIDIMQPEIELIITEGIFDIIGVYLHFYQNNDKNKIFAAACGKAYNAVILNYIRMGLLNLNISIYSDGDVNLNFYRDLKNSSPYLKNKQITIYYNSLYDPKTGFGKDYGVPIENIKLRKSII